MNLKTVLRVAGIIAVVAAAILSIASLDDHKVNAASALALAVTSLAFFKGAEMS